MGIYHDSYSYCLLFSGSEGADGPADLLSRVAMQGYGSFSRIQEP